MSSIRLPSPRGQHTCVLFHNVVLLFFGVINSSSSSSSNTCRSVDMFDLTNETWTCLGESVPSYQCEPIVATGQLILLSNRNDTQMLHKYRLRMQQHDEFLNGQTVKLTASNDDLTSANSTAIKEKMQLSRVSNETSPLLVSISSFFFFLDSIIRQYNKHKSMFNISWLLHVTT